jgi:hypothetical protein
MRICVVSVRPAGKGMPGPAHSLRQSSCCCYTCAPAAPSSERTRALTTPSVRPLPVLALRLKSLCAWQAITCRHRSLCSRRSPPLPQTLAVTSAQRCHCPLADDRIGWVGLVQSNPATGGCTASDAYLEVRGAVCTAQLRTWLRLPSCTCQSALSHECEGS